MTNTAFFRTLYAALIEIGGFAWPTTEHYFQAQKFIDPNRQAAFGRQQHLVSPKNSPGRTAQVSVPIWDAARDEVLLVALRAKFTQHPDLRARLLATGDAVVGRAHAS